MAVVVDDVPSVGQRLRFEPHLRANRSQPDPVGEHGGVGQLRLRLHAGADDLFRGHLVGLDAVVAALLDSAEHGGGAVREDVGDLVGSGALADEELGQARIRDDDDLPANGDQPPVGRQVAGADTRAVHQHVRGRACGRLGQVAQRPTELHQAAGGDHLVEEVVQVPGHGDHRRGVTQA